MRSSIVVAQDIRSESDISLLMDMESARRLKRSAESTDQTQPIHAVTKQELETYLAQFRSELH